LRKEHDYAFSPKTWDGGMPFSWKSESNGDTVAWDRKRVMMHYYDDGNGPYGPELVVAINMEASETVTFTLPSGRTWARVVDTQRWFDDDAFLAANPDLDPSTSWNVSLDAPEPVGATYDVPPRTIVVFEQQ
jgi:glycogen operon protein